MKKILALLVVICLVLSFAACGGDDASSDAASSGGENSSAVQSDDNAEPLGPEKVTKVFEVKYENRYVVTDSIKDTFYDTENGNTLPYRLFKPKDYDPAKKYPVLLFLHGAGETGTDNSRQLNNINNMFEYNGDIVSGAFILCPQSAGWWNLGVERPNDYKGSLGSAFHLLQSILSQYSCDRNRVYVTGLSMGGYATWDLLEWCSDTFAAGVPICGGGSYYNAEAYVDTPIMIYHGTADTTVSFSASERMYNAIVAAGGKKVKLIRLDGVGHNAWDYAYADREMFTWLFAQDKSKGSSVEYEYAPRFSIRNAKGNVVISDSDVVKTGYCRAAKKSEKMVIKLTLTSAGRSKLNNAYKKSNGAEFTFYYGSQKVYSFTATDPLIDNVFRIADVFDIDSYLKFYRAIEKTGN